MLVRCEKQEPRFKFSGESFTHIYTQNPFGEKSGKVEKQKISRRMEMWKDRKLVGGWKSERIEKFSFPQCVFGWRGEKVRGWKTL